MVASAGDPTWLQEVRRGTSDQSPPAQQVTYGDFTALIMGPELRYVCMDGREILRRVHVAVRDPAWGTVPPRPGRVRLREAADDFELRADIEHVEGPLDFRWSAQITGSTTGTLTFSMAGSCRTDFLFNRIGLCVLLPTVGYRGASYVAEGPSGVAHGELPDVVGPQLIVHGQVQPLFPAFSRLEVHLPGGAEVQLSLDGDLFEMEDQRNWTDASFKVYSTPLGLPRPQVAHRGDVLRQQLTMSVAHR